MLYFKHSELVTDYRVSLKTVHNWIAAAKKGKLPLQLTEHNGKTYLSNTTDNVAHLRQLATAGKKYRNTLHHKTVTPKPEFYKHYSRRQVLDIISNLNIHHEIPRQYNYINNGATYWDGWLKKLRDDDAPNILKGSLELIHSNLGPLSLLLEGRKKVNIIDLGAGNALPVKELLAHLMELGILHRYLAIDISETMLDIARKNVTSWYGDRVRFEGHIRDIGYERFDDLLVDDMLGSDPGETVNIVLLLGATQQNFRSPIDVIKVVSGSMGDQDLLITTTVESKPNADIVRRYFNFNQNDAEGVQKLAPTHSFILDLLNIDDSLYDVETGFNDSRRMRYVRIRLKSALTLVFQFSDGEHRVTLEKGEAILMLRVWHKGALENLIELEEAGFKLLHASMTRDRQYLLTISGVDTQVEE